MHLWFLTSAEYPPVNGYQNFLNYLLSADTLSGPVPAWYLKSLLLCAHRYDWVKSSLFNFFLHVSLTLLQKCTPGSLSKGAADAYRSLKYLIHPYMMNSTMPTRESTNTTHYHIVTLSMVGRLDPITSPIYVIQKWPLLFRRTINPLWKWFSMSN